MLANGKPDPYSLHGGCPVITGVKCTQYLNHMLTWLTQFKVSGNKWIWNKPQGVLDWRWKHSDLNIVLSDNTLFSLEWFCDRFKILPLTVESMYRTTLYSSAAIGLLSVYLYMNDSIHTLFDYSSNQSCSGVSNYLTSVKPIEGFHVLCIYSTKTDEKLPM